MARLQRLEKVRALAKDQAAREAAEAEGTLAQLNALIARTRAMAADYHRVCPDDGFALRQVGQFISGLQGIAHATTGNAEEARTFADRKQAELAQAERCRAAVEDRLDAARRHLAQRGGLPALGGRSPLGTALE